MSGIEIVNIVAVGEFKTGFNLKSVYEYLEITHIQYDPESFPGLQIRSALEGGVMTLFSSGTFTITGVDTEEELNSLFDLVLTELENIELGITEDVEFPEVRNLVCTLDLEIELNLSNLVMFLGIERTEYEPEQSAFVYYWPDNHDCLFTIPSNGKVAVTGVQQFREAEQAFEHLQSKIRNQDNLLLNRQKTGSTPADE